MARSVWPPRDRAVPPPCARHRPADESNPKARTGICGIAPNATTLRRTCDTLSPEHALYPARFLKGFGLVRYVMCEELRYNGQRRRDVPDLASGTLYIDVGDRATRCEPLKQSNARPRGPTRIP